MQVPSASKPSSVVKSIDESSGEEILDTFEIVYQVKGILEENGISPRVFGDEYLHCTSSMCADLMIRTKSFENSKASEKLMYTRMKTFLSDPIAIPLLVEKEESKETVKAKIESVPAPREAPRPVKRKHSSDTDDYDLNTKKPIQRTVITDYQKDTSTGGKTCCN